MSLNAFLNNHNLLFGSGLISDYAKKSEWVYLAHAAEDGNIIVTKGILSIDDFLEKRVDVLTYRFDTVFTGNADAAQAFIRQRVAKDMNRPHADLAYNDKVSWGYDVLAQPKPISASASFLQAVFDGAGDMVEQVVGANRPPVLTPQ